MAFQEQIQQGIPTELPQPKPYESQINHAPKRKEILNEEENCFSNPKKFSGITKILSKEKGNF